jgi:restriction endonuclease S subunit
MAVWSEVKKSDLHLGMRLGAEFYQPQYLQDTHILSSQTFERLGNLLKVFYRYPTCFGFTFTDDGVPFLKGEDIDSFGFVKSKHGDCMPRDISIQFPLTVIDTDDIIISVRGLVGKVGLIGKDLKGAQISPNLIRAKVDRKKIDPVYLWIFLNSGFGQRQFQRYKMRTSQETIVSSDMRNFLIVMPSEETKASVHELVETVRSLFETSKLLYTEAESLLESALGLDKLDLAPRLFYERHYANVQAAERFDAEYFQPRMQNLIATLSRDGQTIANVAKLGNHRFKANAGVEFQYIEIGYTSGSGTVDSNPVAGEEAPSRATWIVKAGDIITTTVRPIRRLSAIITDDQSGNVCSSGFAVLTPKNIAPELLLVFLRLPLVCELLDLHTTASMYPAISKTDLMKIPIALPSNTTCKSIVAKVRKSFDARSEARRLLDEAKAMVEKAILGNRIRHA